MQTCDSRFGNAIRLYRSRVLANRRYPHRNDASAQTMHRNEHSRLAGRGPRGGGASTSSWAQRPDLMNLHCCRCSASIKWAKGKSSSTSTGPRLAWFRRGTSCPSQCAPAPPHQQLLLPLGEATTVAEAVSSCYQRFAGAEFGVQNRFSVGHYNPYQNGPFCELLRLKNVTF